jgi:hypothetical protein
VLGGLDGGVEYPGLTQHRVAPTAVRGTSSLSWLVTENQNGVVMAPTPRTAQEPARSQRGAVVGQAAAAGVHQTLSAWPFAASSWFWSGTSMV